MLWGIRNHDDDSKDNNNNMQKMMISPFKTQH